MDTVPVPLLRYIRRPDQCVSDDTLVHKSAPIFSHYNGNDHDHVVVAATFILHDNTKIIYVAGSPCRSTMQFHMPVRSSKVGRTALFFSAARPDRVAELYDDEAARTEICYPRQSVLATRLATPFAPANNADDDDDDNQCHRIRVAMWSSGQTLDVQHTRGGLHAHAWC